MIDPRRKYLIPDCSKFHDLHIDTTHVAKITEQQYKNVTYVSATQYFLTHFRHQWKIKKEPKNNFRGRIARAGLWNLMQDVSFYKKIPKIDVCHDMANLLQF